jgi:hypothetical protein
MASFIDDPQFGTKMFIIGGVVLTVLGLFTVEGLVAKTLTAMVGLLSAGVAVSKLAQEAGGSGD